MNAFERFEEMVNEVAHIRSRAKGDFRRWWEGLLTEPCPDTDPDVFTLDRDDIDITRDEVYYFFESGYKLGYYGSQADEAQAAADAKESSDQPEKDLSLDPMDLIQQGYNGGYNEGYEDSLCMLKEFISSRGIDTWNTKDLLSLFDTMQNESDDEVLDAMQEISDFGQLQDKNT